MKFKWNFKYNKTVLKYKKTIFGVSVAVLLVGMAGISLGKSDKAADTVGNNQATEAPSVQPTATATPDIKTEELKENADKEINDMITKYFEASLKADVKALHNIVSEPEQLKAEELKKKFEFIEAVKNISCYTLDGPEEGSKIVYVYHEYKFTNIETPAPGMSRFYISKAEDDNYVILLNKLDEDIQTVVDRSAENEQVKNLINNVNKKLEEAMTKDAVLKKFVDELNQKAEETKAPEGTKAPEASKTPEATSTPAATSKPKATSTPKAN